MGKEIFNDDMLSRMVCLNNKKSYCRVSKEEVKPKAFKPHSSGETSMFVISGLSEEQIWGLGEDHLCGKSLVYGRADVLASVVLGLEKIKVDYNNEPKYHANLNWPDNKEEIQDIAQVLAAKADCIQR